VTAQLTVDAFAKLNLYLDVLRRLPSGYHEIKTLFHSVSLADRLVVEVHPNTEGVVIECDHPDVPCDRTNLAARAAEAFLGLAGLRVGVVVRITKRIPIGGGLGGGSADAAATLVALDRLTGQRHSLGDLQRLGAELGADVPFCIAGGAAWGYGTGTELVRVEPAAGTPVLLVNPGVRIDTGWAYRALAISVGESAETGFALTDGGASATIQPRPPCGEACGKPSSEPVSAVMALAYNRFQDVVAAAYPEIGDALAGLRSSGATAMMSGSGATVFGVFLDASARDAAYRALRSRFAFVEPAALVSCGVGIVDASPADGSSAAAPSATADTDGR